MKFIRDIIGEKRQLSHQANGISAANGANSLFVDELLGQTETENEINEQQFRTVIEDLTFEDLVVPAAQSDHVTELKSSGADDLDDGLANVLAQEEKANGDAETEGADAQPNVSWVAEPQDRTPEMVATAKVDPVAGAEPEPFGQVPVRQDADPVGRTPSETPSFHRGSGDILKEVSAEASQPMAPSAHQSVDVPQPAMGRGASRQGRVKTRLLGFNSGDDTDIDPIAGREEAQAAAYTKFPLGWLIVIGGPGRGSAFTLFNGVSKIGRGKDQTVSLDFGDNSISRENHAAIAYDPAQQSFFIGHGGKANLVRRNDRPVLSTEELAAGDEITIGETMLRFVPLCGAEFTWEELKESGWSHASNG